MKAPMTPPPLDMPSHQRTSGLAVMSLTFALVGAFTIVGTIAGIVLGVVALRQIARQPSKLAGVGLARAGILVGAFFTFFTLLTFSWPVLTLNVDEYLRWLAYASRSNVPDGGRIQANAAFKDNISIKVPLGWRQYTSPNANQTPFTPDDLIAIHIPQDAFIACQNIAIDILNDESAEARQEKALERFHKSELVHIIGRLGTAAFGGAKGEVSGLNKIDGAKEQEFFLDMRLNGHNRRFLIRWKVVGDVKLVVMAGGAPSSRFHRVENDIREAFKTVEIK